MSTSPGNRINRAERIKNALKNKNFKGKGSTIRIDPKGKKKKKNRKKGITQSRDISIRASAEVRNTIYGTMRVGSVVSFMDAGGNQESKAHLTTGTGNSSIGWVAKEAGAEGNDISITIVVPSSNPSISVGVVGSAITVTAESSGGNSLSSANEVIQAIQGNVAATALVSVNRGGEKGGANVQALSTTNLTGGGGTWLHMVHTLCGHEIDVVEKIFINGRELVLGGSPDPRWATGFFQGFAFATLNYGETDQEAIGDLIQQLPDKWGANDRQRGCAHVYTINIFKENIYSGGDPEYSFLVHGKKVLDPRTGQTVWSNNAALVALDHLLTAKQDGGCGVAQSKIDLENFKDAADICDEEVTIAAGGTEPRYTINIDFEWDNQPRDMLEIFAQAMMGSIIKYNGKWRCFPGTWREPVMDLNEDDVRGAIQITARNEKKLLYNRAKGTFLDPNQDYEQVDLPAVKNGTYLTQDGGEENWFDIDLNGVTSPGQGQRILKYRMEESRQGTKISFPASLRTYKLHPEDNIRANLARYGYVTKYFKVVDIDFEISGQEGQWCIKPILYLQETAEELYDWNEGEETIIDPAPDTNLPDPLTAIAPSNVLLESGTDQLFLQLSGHVMTRLKVSWDMATSPFTLFGGYHEIQYKKSADGNWSNSETVLGDSNFHHIINVQDGVAYDVRIRAVNALRHGSSWVQVLNHTVIGKTAPPSNVSNFNAVVTDFGIKFNWSAIADIDSDVYQIREGSNWNTATTIATVRSSDGNVFNYEVLTAGTRTFLIKAIDTSGNYSLNATSVSVTILSPHPVNNFVPNALGNNVVLDWRKPNATTLTVNKYLVYKGDDFETADLVGEVFGTFHTYIERFGGTFTYWIVAVDVGGNLSTAVSDSVLIIPSDDFYIQADLDLFASLSSQAFISTNAQKKAIYAPVGVEAASLPLLLNTGQGEETWRSHFENNGFTTIQEFIDAGYVKYLQPTPTGVTAHFEFAVDYVVTFASSFIDFRYSVETLGGSCVIVPYIATSPDGTVWTEYNDTTQAFASNFRYVRYGVRVTADDDKSLVKFTGLRAILQVQRAEEAQIITAQASDHPTGTLVTFVKPFLDVEDIQVSVNSDTEAKVAYVYNFSVVPAQGYLHVLVWDPDGDPITKQVTCRIRGAVNV